MVWGRGERGVSKAEKTALRDVNAQVIKRIHASAKSLETQSGWTALSEPEKKAV